MQVVHSKHIHQSHPELIKRLKRADGHLHNVIEMMVSGRDCADVAQQLHAVEKAINAAKKLLIHDHLDHCLDELVRSPGDLATGILSFKNVTKYL